MDYKQILQIASNHLISLENRIIPVLDVAKPDNLEYANHLAKVVSKLSPLVGNMIEFYVCSELNKLEWNNQGEWIRQDPGFPDTIFRGEVSPAPGIEIKTWFPLATEITARFKDSINFFEHNQTNVALVAWLPEFIIYGKPKILDVWVGTAQSLAMARDSHYHNPPDYLVFEPEDTTSRTVNLQQTNVNGYKFQGVKELLKEAQSIVDSWEFEKGKYYHTLEYQQKIKQLLGTFPYRLDTNFAKIDRIRHTDLEDFKTKVLQKSIHGHTIREWSKLFGDNTTNITSLLDDLL
ncbi:hypothetical protein [uncultured Elizabethkingia sp.]|uniref:hypothetical protein n=1 Tax=uncultured Elizabethkingia sp. TaxID=432638 RepID=UPI002597683A|nr:hypothetical protein [uncultured Elizabethkingia sp.]